MAADPKKRQKKQERRAAKRKSKHHQLAKAKNTGLAERLAAAVKYPILHSWVTTEVWTEGMGWVCLSRELPNGSVAFALFLIDRYCLGVKNAMADVAGRFTYDSRIVRKMRSNSTVEEIAPAAARKLVESAVDYARGLGLHPHPDYLKAKQIFGAIDAAECTEEFEFGKDGKPFFIAGPNDTPERCRQILKTLEQSCGAGGFHYLLPWSGDSSVLPESIKRNGVRVIGPDEAGGLLDYHEDFSDEELADEDEADQSD